MPDAAQGQLEAEIGGETHHGTWALDSSGVLTVLHGKLGRRRTALLNSDPRELAELLLRDIVRQAGFTGSPRRRSSVYAEGSYPVTALGFLASWAWFTWEFGWLLGFGLGWIPAIVVGAVSGIAWPVVVPIAVGAGAYLLLR